MERLYIVLRTRRTNFLCIWMLQLAVLAATGCGGDGPPTHPSGGDTPSIGMTVNNSSLGLAQGQSGIVTVNLMRSGGFSGVVDLSVEGVPNGVTSSFEPASLTAGAASSTLKLQVTSAAKAGAFSLVIRARGQGIAERTATFELVVRGSYTLTVSPASVTFAQGGSGSATVNIDRTGGYSGAVSLAASGAPNGLTATLDPGSTGGQNATLTMSATAALAPGGYTVTIRGTAQDLPDQMTSVSIQITASSSKPSSNSVTVSVGAGYACAILGEQPYCWGSNRDGVLGIGTFQEFITSPRKLFNDLRLRQISAGNRYTCGVGLDGRGYCWGYSDASGRLGYGGLEGSQNIPTPVVSGSVRFSAIETGYTHTCGLTPEGKVFCWGNNTYGQLGAAVTGYSGCNQSQAPCTSLPTEVETPLRFTKIVVGERTTCGIVASGSIYCWGLIDRQETAARPQLIGVQGEYREFDFGGLRFPGEKRMPLCAITTGGSELHCFYTNSPDVYGQRSDFWGLSAIKKIALPFSARGVYLLPANADVYSHSRICVISTQDRAYCWGQNGGMLGDGTTIDLRQRSRRARGCAGTDTRFADRRFQSPALRHAPWDGGTEQDQCPLRSIKMINPPVLLRPADDGADAGCLSDQRARIGGC